MWRGVGRFRVHAGADAAGKMHISLERQPGHFWYWVILTFLNPLIT